MVTLDASKQVGALFGIPGSNVWLSQLGSTISAGVQSAKAFPNGDLVVGGSFGGQITLGTTMLTSKGTGSGFVARLRAADGTVMWFKQYDSSKALGVSAVSVDASGNAVIGGGFSGTAALNGTNVSAAGNAESFVGKLAGADGSFVWVKVLNSTDSSFPAGVAVDSAGDIVVAGTFTGSISPGPLPLEGEQSAFMVKYSPAGAHIWSKALLPASGGHMVAAAVAVDSSSNVVIGGNFFGSVDFGSGAVTATNTSNSTAAFVGKYAAADGSHLVDKEYNLAGTDYASIRSLTVDGSNAIYVAGEFTGTLSLTAPPLTSNVGNFGDVYIAKFSTAGAPTWSVGFGNDKPDLANFISTDAAGQLLFAGTFQGIVSYGGTTFTSAGNEDIVLAHLNSANGQVLKALRLGGTGGEGASVVVGAGTNVFVAGTFQGFSEFGGQALTSHGVNDDGFSLMLMPLN